MEKATRYLNVCTLLFIVLTGIYIHLQFERILNGFSLIMLWGTIALFVSFHLESTFEIRKRIGLRVVK